MHESGIVNGLIARLQAVAQEQGARHVSAARIWLGALSQFSAEHFRLHFDAAAVGTVAQGARLEIQVSDDPLHEGAQQVILQSIELET